ncbi:hypothetical protein [Tenacibaculum finnmarkense]|uniref:hypothetical protein n=1 Tax=Tenacibaculum finnmarkense TaxID=2781243 RepID=UPI00187B6527|nr:hypothetical protein [Tenacibaculum finnmarkense]MBE7646803.1 hypothetical protein [Tenacibaculum finnmarkense genomovar ulcerans]MBE7649006.1 hypothetical protein [Tenacibaculum finnmarkense genomovar ulcerans]MCD8401306.1 hypothetical protein [Tenacibaculum finnmarkense genomovar ulcerans]MCD8423644.1 hypothetical protein [Tenacibaculum finnmarkense genomovar ulcerans]MCD8433632.1 hypothetical protein [Tenacibaculum finnmarkense genomovar ulcerans]
MFIQVTLNAKLQPMHRHDLEDALTEIFEKQNIKAEITGGGTGQETNGEIAYSDLEIDLEEPSEEVIKQIIDLLEKILAPNGSKVTIFSEYENVEAKVIPFGKHEGLGLYLSNDLDNKVYEECDVNVVYGEIQKLLNEENLGRIESHWEGEETALYLYGKSFDEMQKVLKPFLDKYPLCEKCRIVKIA